MVLFSFSEQDESLACLRFVKCCIARNFYDGLFSSLNERGGKHENQCANSTRRQPNSGVESPLQATSEITHRYMTNR